MKNSALLLAVWFALLIGAAFILETTASPRFEEPPPAPTVANTGIISAESGIGHCQHATGAAAMQALVDTWHIVGSYFHSSAGQSDAASFPDPEDIH